ncbi:acyl-CoA dehydrogenase, partial [Burkholderia pseudomallei]
HPESFELARRYAVLAAAAACVGVWRAERMRAGASFVGAPVWLEAALSRLSERLGMPKQPAPPHVCDAIVSELVARADEHRSFCLYHARLNGGADVPASV